jgi:hypothetical protein
MLGEVYLVFLRKVTDACAPAADCLVSWLRREAVDDNGQPHPTPAFFLDFSVRSSTIHHGINQDYRSATQPLRSSPVPSCHSEEICSGARCQVPRHAAIEQGGRQVQGEARTQGPRVRLIPISKPGFRYTCSLATTDFSFLQGWIEGC